MAVLLLWSFDDDSFQRQDMVRRCCVPYAPACPLLDPSDFVAADARDIDITTRPMLRFISRISKRYALTMLRL